MTYRLIQMDKRIKNFKNFLYLCWKHLNLPEPTPIQYDIADYLQSSDKRLVIEAFRGVGKSWITSAFVCHQLQTYRMRIFHSLMNRFFGIHLFWIAPIKLMLQTLHFMSTINQERTQMLVPSIAPLNLLPKPFWNRVMEMK